VGLYVQSALVTRFNENITTNDINCSFSDNHTKYGGNINLCLLIKYVILFTQIIGSILFGNECE